MLGPHVVHRVILVVEVLIQRPLQVSRVLVRLVVHLLYLLLHVVSYQLGLPGV